MKEKLKLEKCFTSVDPFIFDSSIIVKKVSFKMKKN